MPRPLSTLARELGKRKPFLTADEEAFVSLVRSASMLTRQTDRVLREHRLSGASYNILRILRGAGAIGRCSHEIAAQVLAEVPDMTRLIDRLERLDLCERRRVDGDRRLVRIFIRPKGLELLRSLDKPIVELHRRQFEGVPARRVEQLLDILEEVRSSLRDA